MKERILRNKAVEDFEKYLYKEEKSENTIQKYLHDVRAFMIFAGESEIAKETVIAYKNKLINENYAVRSINSMLASLNSLVAFLCWSDCRVKSIKLQRQVYCPEEKELTKAEYIRLVNTAKQRGNERLNLILQTICGTGIRVSELQFITVEAIKNGEAIVSLKGKTRSVFIVSEIVAYLNKCVAVSRDAWQSPASDKFILQIANTEQHIRSADAAISELMRIFNVIKNNELDSGIDNLEAEILAAQNDSFFKGDEL